jgi:hypothetical protein
METDTPALGVSTSQIDFDAMIDPALRQQGLPAPAIPAHPPSADTFHLVQLTTETVGILTQEMNDPAQLLQRKGSLVGIEPSIPYAERHIDPLLDQQMVDTPLSGTAVKPEPTTITMEHISSQTPAASLASPPDSTMAELASSPVASNGMNITTSIESNGEKSETSHEDFYTPVSASRQSSRQPKLVDRYVPETNQVMLKPTSKPGKADRRYSSSGASGETAGGSDKSRRSSSNTSGTTHQMAATLQNGGIRSRENSVRPGSRGSTALGSEGDGDEQFARELQAQENGLRRRTTSRV